MVRIVYGVDFKDHTDVIFHDLKIDKVGDLVKQLKTWEVMCFLTKHCLLFNKNYCLGTKLFI